LNTSLFVNNQFFFFNNQKSILDSGLNAQDLSLYFNFICHDRNLSLTQYGASNNTSFFTLPAELSLAKLNSTFFSKLALQQVEKTDSITSNLFRFTLSLNSLLGSANSSFYNFFLFADQDFKRWSSAELLEDLVWNASALDPLHIRTLDKQSLLPHRFNSKLFTLFKFNYFGDVAYNTNFYSYPSSFYQNVNNHTFFFASLNYWVSDALTSSFLTFKSAANLSLNLKNWLVSTNLYFSNISNFSLNALYSNLNLKFQAPQSTLALQQPDAGFGNSMKFVFHKIDQTQFYKNINSYYGALWKVFKSTLDEERGHFTIKNYSNIDFKLPMVMTNPGSLLDTLQKNNASSFISIPLFQTFYNFEPRAALLSDQRYLNSFAFPFGVGFESDIIRYSWFDWYSLRNNIITKAIDTSSFNLNAVRDYDYTFTSKPDLAIINKTDNFFLKYSLARKMYIPGYYYTPYFLNKHADWYSYNSILLNFKSTKLTTAAPFAIFKTIIDVSAINFNDLASDSQGLPSNSLNSLNSNFSSIFSANRGYFSTYNSFKNQVHVVSLLFDILSKKDYLMKSFKSSVSFSKNSSLISSNPSVKSPIIQFVKLVNNINTDALASSAVVNSSSKSVPLKHSLLTNTGIYKQPILTSQYQPLKKGIVNMIRIQADKAVAMPTDTRIQILAVSKDIIHSWSIPSAGIKIDCIPGYSSHRVAIFTLSGVYWGQCMEICGRFHHWMPIVVYFIRRDLFCLWCVHFIYKNSQTNGTLHTFDGAYKDSFSGISYSDKLWSYDLL
jgi:hypothetical protein